MLITFVTWLFAPAGAIVAAMFLLIVPGLAYSWHQVRRFGARKSAIQASNASAIVEHVTGMQTLRAYGIGGTANERIVESMRAFSANTYRNQPPVTPPPKTPPAVSAALKVSSIIPSIDTDSLPVSRARSASSAVKETPRQSAKEAVASPASSMNS